MTEYAKLVVAVDSTQVTKAGKEIDKLPGKAGKAEQSANRMSKAFLKLGGVLATALSVREVVQAAEAYTNITNRLRLVTEGAEGLAKAQTDLFNIAQRSRQPLTETAELYQRIAQNQAELKLSSDDVARITETISKSLAVSGANAASAAGAMVQLGQAFASGTLRGEELNSVLENAPALAQALARGMGVTVGQLRALGQEGVLTARNVVDALQQQADSIDSAFGTLAPTISSAMTTVNNAFTQLVGKMDDTSGASGGLAESLLDVANLLQDPKTIDGLMDLANGLVTLTSWLISGASAAANFFDEFTDGLAGIRNVSEITRMEEEVYQLQVELNNLTADLMQPDWMLSIRGLDRGEIQAQATSLQLTMQGLKGTLAEMREEATFAGISADLDSVLEKLGGFTGELKKASGAVIDLGDGGKAADKLASAFASMRGNLAEQVALYGSIGEAAKVRYEIESGSLRGLAQQKQDEIMGLARELDLKRDLTEQEQLRIDILRESGQLRAANDAQFQLEYAEKIAAYEAAGNAEALQRLETLRQIRAIQLESSIPAGTVEGVSQAPDSEGPDAMFGGAAGEFAKLEEERVRLDEWRATELEMQRAFLDAKAINEEQHAERVRNINAQHQQEMTDIEAARQRVALTATEDMFGSMADLTKQFAGENSAAYKVMFAAEKAVAIARSMLAIQTGIALAAANPWPANLAAMAMVAANTASIIGNISSIGLAGQAHDGIDSIPREGTWLLDKGERVVDRRTNADLKDFLAAGGARPGGGGQSTTVNLIEDASKSGQTQTRQMDGKQVIDLFVANIMQDGQASKALKQRFGLRNAAS